MRSMPVTVASLSESSGGATGVGSLAPGIHGYPTDCDDDTRRVRAAGLGACRATAVEANTSLHSPGRYSRPARLSAAG